MSKPSLKLTTQEFIAKYLMNFEIHRIAARHETLRLITIIGILALLPWIALAEEDTVQTTNSTPSDRDLQADSNKGSSLLGDHADIFVHNAALFEALTQANQEELLALLEESRDSALGSVRDETIFAIAGRFTVIDPQAALAKFEELGDLERDPFLRGMFSEWCVSNLDEAITAATKLNRRERLSTLLVILSVRDDLTEARHNEIARKLGHSDFATYFESDSKAIEFADDPKTAWNVLINDGLDDFSQLDTLVLVAETLIEEQGFEALFHLHEPFDIGFRIIGRTYIFDVVLSELVKNDPQNTWQYIQSGSTQTSDPLEGSDQSQDPSTVSPREQAYMADRVQHLLIRSWAEVYPETVLAEIAQIPHKLQPDACEHALAALVATDPERTIELIHSLAPYGARNDATLEEVIRRWSALDPAAALDWVLSASEMDNVATSNPGRWPSNKLSIMRTAFAAHSLEDPKRALQLASQQEESKYLEGWIMRELARSDVESAIEVLPLVSQSGRTSATETVAEALAESGEVERGMEFLHQYENSSGEEVSWYWFFRSWADYNAVDLFERLDEFEPKLRTAAARALGYIHLPGFTQEQLDYISAIYDWDNPPE
ncbi:MAG: hypothetical protein F4X56_08295 [Gammaproteobacteria bacterium]|nr:hypothetical protein [Gammaproteobacteria bacterium]